MCSSDSTNISWIIYTCVLVVPQIYPGLSMCSTKMHILDYLCVPLKCISWIIYVFKWFHKYIQDYICVPLKCISWIIYVFYWFHINPQIYPGLSMCSTKMYILDYLCVPVVVLIYPGLSMRSSGSTNISWIIYVFH